MSTTRLRIGSVSYLNARPLISGLDERPDDAVLLDVPSRLMQGLIERRYDAALLPIIDYQRMAGLRVIPAGAIGCDGESLTVRIFSRMPLDRIETLGCDPDSHTSVALARIVLDRLIGVKPKLLPRLRDGQAMLLIGDKVVCDAPAGFEHQLDLGRAWKQLTGLPFVFATWMAPADVDLGDLPRRLEQARRCGLERIGQIVEQHAVPRGWPAELARDYLSKIMRYDLGPRQIEAIELFFRFAAEYDLIPPPRPLEFAAGRWIET